VTATQSGVFKLDSPVTPDTANLIWSLPRWHEDFNRVFSLNQRLCEGQRSAPHRLVRVESEGADHRDSHGKVLSRILLSIERVHLLVFATMLWMRNSCDSILAIEPEERDITSFNSGR
jgi:hypothetical protein